MVCKMYAQAQHFLLEGDELLKSNSGKSETTVTLRSDFKFLLGYISTLSGDLVNAQIYYRETEMICAKFFQEK